MTEFLAGSIVAILCAVIFLKAPTSSLVAPVNLFGLVFGLFYGFRLLIFGLGLDTPTPDYLFFGQDSSELVYDAALALTAFLLAGAAAFFAVYRRGGERPPSFFTAVRPPLRRQHVLCSLLTACSLLVAAYLLVKFGGFGAVIRAAKVEKELAGLYPLRIPATLGALLSAALAADALRSRRFRLAVTGVVFMLVNGLTILMWGTRSLLIVAAAGFILAAVVPWAGGPRVRRRGAPWVAITVVVGVVFAGSLGLRVARDNLVRGETSVVVAEATLARQVSLASNAVYLDASLLGFKDFPDPYEFRNGEDFVNGAVGPVPRALWPEKPRGIEPGKWFRQLYQPEKVNGWPVGAPTIWYINFGWLGILLGGLLSGAVYGWFSRQFQRASVAGINTMMSLLIAVYVFQTGVDSTAPLHFVTQLVPMWLAMLWLTRGRRGDEPLHLPDMAAPRSVGAPPPFQEEARHAVRP